jgi:hypothetical protein
MGARDDANRSNMALLRCFFTPRFDAASDPAYTSSARTPFLSVAAPKKQKRDTAGLGKSMPISVDRRVYCG